MTQADPVEEAVNDLQNTWRIEHHTAVHLLRLIGHVGGRTTSGGRTREHNKAVGGAPGSDHLWGGAFDHVPDTRLGDDVRQWLSDDRCGSRCRGPRYVLNEADHLHWSDKRRLS
jgi:hypothetical protein